MQGTEDHFDRFRASRCCVLIPTYNNAGTLKEVLSEVLEYTDQVIVVNDGSDDTTSTILEAFSRVDVLAFQQNRGKGVALREGSRYAYDKGYQYAITIDSDGQHAASDLPRFIDKVEEEPGALVVGARNMEQEGIPGGSSFGNKFSNFWYKVETGIELPDTQSGYRIYPLRPLRKMRFFTSRYEFEIEVLVRMAWKGVPVKSVPVHVHYAPEGERVSHFRPYWDFFRISVLNTVLVLLAFLMGRPLMFWRKLRQKDPRQIWREQVLHSRESDRKKALSVAFGVFMGVVPIWGYQLATAILLAYLLRLNKMIVILAAQISIPPFIPFIIWGSYQAGGLFFADRAGVTYSSSLSLESIGSHLSQYLVGSMTLAVGLSLCLGSITYVLLQLYRRPKLTRRR